MPSIHEIASNIANSKDSERHHHLKRMKQHTGRNVICYYSGFLQNSDRGDTGINDKDLHGFMSTVYRLDKSKGLDLLIHTPGGDAAATESIVSYIRSVFGNDVSAYVPHMAMSAGTMLACSCKEIVMGKHSSLGPIDPQYGGTPALDIIEEFNKAKEEIIENPASMNYWGILLSKYPGAIYEKCVKAFEFSETLVQVWLRQNMLKSNPGEVVRVLRVLNENKESKTHRRHFDKEKCKNSGLTIIDLEDDQKLQDIVLSIHHCYVHLFNETQYSKIIENHLGISVVN
jgi:ATP-dependent protease ClpP protease subunit